MLNGYFQRIDDAIPPSTAGMWPTFWATASSPISAHCNPIRGSATMPCARPSRGACGHPRIQCRARAGGAAVPCSAGIGIDRGLGLVGLVGSRERMEYDFVGRTVNVAARVQTLTRIHQADILVTEALRAELDARFVLMPMPAELRKRDRRARGNLRRA